MRERLSQLIYTDLLRSSQIGRRAEEEYIDHYLPQLTHVKKEGRM